MLSINIILQQLDGYLGKNDYASAECHLLNYLRQAKEACDNKCLLAILNELAGLYRKLSRESDALKIVFELIELIKTMGIEDNVGAATTFINCATVYKAFKRAEKAMPLFEKAKIIYEKQLQSNDKRLGGLYNNMALALVDLKEFDKAYELYNKAILVMENTKDGDLEVAITFLNIASAKEEELGLEQSEEIIKEYIEKAILLLDSHINRDGYYAFVCEKCASVFGYYGYFIYENELIKRANAIYERS